MKKIKYYAPYWVTVIVLVLAVIVYMSFLRPYPFVKLPELAATLESNEYFLREDGAVMKNAGKSDYLAAPPTDKKPYNVLSLKAKSTAEMLPHEYAALVSDRHIFVSKDGSIFTTGHDYTVIDPHKPYLCETCTPSQLPDNASEANMEVTKKSDRYSAQMPASIEVRTPVGNDAATLNWYLSIKLSDGWYVISKGKHHSIIIGKDGVSYFHLSVPFPALHEGDYRLEFDIHDNWSYREMTLTRKDTDNYTLSYD